MKPEPVPEFLSKGGDYIRFGFKMGKSEKKTVNKQTKLRLVMLASLALFMNYKNTEFSFLFMWIVISDVCFVHILCLQESCIHNVPQIGNNLRSISLVNFVISIIHIFLLNFSRIIKSLIRERRSIIHNNYTLKCGKMRFSF